MPFPLIPVLLATALAGTGVGLHNETQNRAANERARAEGNIKFNDYQQTPDGYTVTQRTGFLPENVTWKRPWESSNSFADDLVSKYNARNKVPLSPEVAQQVRKEIEGGSQPLDALRNAVRNVSDAREQAYTQAKFNANQEKAKLEYQGQQQRKQSQFEAGLQKDYMREQTQLQGQLQKEQMAMQAKMNSEDLAKRLAAQEASDMLQAVTRPAQVYRFF